MADTIVSDMTELTAPADGCFIPIVDVSEGDVANQNKKITRKNLAGWTFRTTPLTSTSWDGDSFSTTSKTPIDLSSAFGVPAGVKAIQVVAAICDSGSAAADCTLTLSPNSNNLSGPKIGCSGLANDKFAYATFIVPCDANGDIYYQVVASGTNTLDAYVEIWGYFL